MRGDQFIDVLGEEEVTHLRSRIDVVQLFRGLGVEEAYGAICCATSRGKQAMSMG
jgi:hypothetical protein